MSAALSGTEATPKLAVTRSDPRAVHPRDAQLLDRLAHALGQQRGALDVGLGQHHRQLLAAVAGRLVDVARQVAQHAGHRGQHLVALLVAVLVVDPLEVVDVEHHEAERALEAAARSISRSRIDVEARGRWPGPVSSSVTAWRWTVSWRSAFSIETTAWPARYSSSSSSSRVKARPRRAIEITPRYSGSVVPTSARIGNGERVCAVELYGHGTPRARRRDVRIDGLEQLEAHVRSDVEGLALGGFHGRLEARAELAPARFPKRPALQRQRPTRLGLAGVDRLPDGELHDPLAVEPGGERLADAADRLLQLVALALDLLDLGLELLRHAVELAPELGELVVARDRHGVGEVAPRRAAAPPRGSCRSGR